MTSPHTPGFVDRRQRTQVRAVFEEAYQISLPYLDPAQGIAGQPLTRHVGMTLKARYPNLSDQDRVVLIAALQATFNARQRMP